MKKNKKIAIILLIIAIPLLFITGYTVYANQKAETERKELYEKVLNLQLDDEYVDYLEANKLIDQEDLDNYNYLIDSLQDDKITFSELEDLRESLKESYISLNYYLSEKVEKKQLQSLKKVNTLKAKTKTEKQTKSSIKKVLNKEFKINKSDIENIKDLIKRHKDLKRQDSKINNLNNKIKKRISKENQQQAAPGTNYNSGGTQTPNYQAPNNNGGNSSGGSNNSGGGNSGGNTGGNGRPDWYNQGGKHCEELENGINTDCIYW